MITGPGWRAGGLAGWRTVGWPKGRAVGVAGVAGKVVVLRPTAVTPMPYLGPGCPVVGPGVR